MADHWDPALYDRFKAERQQPFHDLLALVEGHGHRRAVDLGCGTGELTALAVDRLATVSMTGIDSSAAMLDEATPRARAGLAFELGDIGAWGDAHGYDLVIANASLQWVPDHPAVFEQWTAALAAGGQLAVQVPANADHPSHRVAAEVASSDEFASDFPDGAPADPVAANVLRPEDYATLFHELGYDRQHVRLQVYGHLLPTSASVVDWVSGTTLTRFRRVLPPGRYAAFVGRYRDRLLDELGDGAPYFYPFKRILLWGRLAGGHSPGGEVQYDQER